MSSWDSGDGGMREDDENPLAAYQSAPAGPGRGGARRTGPGRGPEPPAPVAVRKDPS